MAVLRGLLHRGGSTVMIEAVALVAIAAAAAGPIYYQAARTSILRDTLVIGAATGLLAAFLTLRSIPEFITRPTVPPLSYVPSAGPLAVVLGAAAALLIIAAVTASVLLIRGVSFDDLRESPT
jgi:hypothetical protein